MMTLDQTGAHGVAGTVSAKWAKGTGGPAGDECYNLVAHTLRGEGFDASEDGTGRGTPLVIDGDRRFLCPCGRQYGINDYPDDPECPDCGCRMPEDLFERDEYVEVFQQNQRDEVRTMAVAGALASEPGMKQQNYLTTAIPRRLTPVECCRLQGFPDDWNEWGVDEDGERVELSDSARYRQCGNAVTVTVSEWIGRRLMDV